MPRFIPQVGGELGVRQTIVTMRSLINGAITDPIIRDQAAFATAHCPKGDRLCQCYSLLSWVKRKMHFTSDPKGVEALHTPQIIARAIHEGKFTYGDCDDFSMYLAALIKSIGMQPTLRAVGYDGNRYQHVYVKCLGMKLDASRDEWATPGSLPHEETSVIELVV